MSEQVRLIDTTHDRNNDFLVKFPFDRQMADDLRQTIPTARWVGGHKAYVVPAAPEPTEALIKWSRLLGFKASQAARDQMVSVRERATAMAELARSMDTDLVIEVEGLTKPLEEADFKGMSFDRSTPRTLEPDAAAHARYGELYGRFLEVNQRMLELSEGGLLRPLWRAAGT